VLSSSQLGAQTLTNAWWDGPSSAPILHLQYDAITDGGYSAWPEVYTSDGTAGFNWGGMVTGSATYDLQPGDIVPDGSFVGFPMVDGDWWFDDGTYGSVSGPFSNFTVTSGTIGGIGNFQVPLIPEAGGRGLAVLSAAFLILVRLRNCETRCLTAVLSGGSSALRSR